MDFIAVLMFPVFAFAAVTVAVRQNGWNNRLKAVSIILGAPFLVLFFDEMLGQAALYAACTINGGTKIIRPVLSDGYFAEYDRVVFEGCALECISALTRHKFKYYEVEVKEGRGYFTNETGIHKFYLAQKGTSECSSKQSKVGGWGEIPDDMCIAYTILPKPSSRYSVTGGIRDRENPSAKIGSWPLGLQKNQTLVRDIRNNELIGSVTTYWYWGGWVRNNSFGHNSASSCTAYPLSHSDVFTKLIRPI